VQQDVGGHVAVANGCSGSVAHVLGKLVNEIAAYRQVLGPCAESRQADDSVADLEQIKCLLFKNIGCNFERIFIHDSRTCSVLVEQPRPRTQTQERMGALEDQ
jgi:hypothetical protein